MFKIQVQNGKDYRTIDPYKSKVEYIEDHLGNRYYIGTNEDRILDTLRDPQFLNDAITAIPGLVNTFVSSGLTNGVENFDSEYIMTAMNVPITMELNLNDLLYTKDNKDFCVKFTEGTSGIHLSWPTDLMNSSTGILVQFATKSPTEDKVDAYTQIIYTNAGDNIYRTCVDDVVSKWFKAVVSDSDKSAYIGNWKIEENNDTSLGFFYNRNI